MSLHTILKLKSVTALKAYWTSVFSSEMPSTTTTKAVAISGDGQHIVAVFDQPTIIRCLVSHDAGVSWSMMKSWSNGYSLQPSSQCCVSDDGQRIIVGSWLPGSNWGLGILEYSSDGGATWGQSAISPSGAATAVFDVKSTPDGLTVYVSYGYQTNINVSPRYYKSTDGGATFTKILGLDAYPTLYTESIGLSDTGQYAAVVALSGSYNRLFCTSDYGSTWAIKYTFGTPSGVSGIGYCGGICISSNGSISLVHGRSNSPTLETRSIVSVDYGATWSAESVISTDGTDDGRSCMASDASIMRVYSSISTSLYESVDYGTTWYKPPQIMGVLGSLGNVACSDSGEVVVSSKAGLNGIVVHYQNSA